jgi:hypothetical protein
MNRRNFLLRSTAAAATATLSSSPLIASVATEEEPRISVLVVDTDRASVPIDKRIYGQFLEHINHSVEDGLFAEQIRGAGFEVIGKPSSSRATSKLPESISRMARRASVFASTGEMRVSSRDASFLRPIPNTMALSG